MSSQLNGPCLGELFVRRLEGNQTQRQEHHANSCHYQINHSCHFVPPPPEGRNSAGQNTGRNQRARRFVKYNPHYANKLRSLEGEPDIWVGTFFWPARQIICSVSPPELALFLIFIIQRLFYNATNNFANRTVNSAYSQGAQKAGNPCIPLLYIRLGSLNSSRIRENSPQKHGKYLFTPRKTALFGSKSILNIVERLKRILRGAKTRRSRMTL